MDDLDKNGFHMNQNRDLDSETVSWFCIGCPYLNIHSQIRNPNSNGSTNSVNFNNVGETYGAFRKSKYFCGSPSPNDKQRISQEHSTIGMGYCPFLEQKLQLFPNLNDDDAGTH